MTTITVKNGERLSKTTFDTWEEVQNELILMQENFKLTPEHIKILKSRENEADNSIVDGLSWEKVKASIKRKNA